MTRAGSTQTAAVLVGHGGLECLRVRHDVAVPSPGVGQVLVAVTAAAVNNTDLWTRQGAYGLAGDPGASAGWRGPISFPRIQGGDIAGRIAEVGHDVDPTRVGQRVVVDPARYDGHGDGATPVALLGSEADGGFAEYVIVDAERAHAMDDSPLTDDQLACLPIAYGTAMGMLQRGRVRPGETVLVTGASGGVGLALVQLAAASGVQVVALTHESVREQVEVAGAARTVSRSAGDLRAQLSDAAPAGLDAVLDVVAGHVLETAFDALTEAGRWVIAGAIAGPVVTIDIRRLYLHQRQLIGSSMHTPAHFRQLVDAARQGRVAPMVAATYPLTEIHQAQRDFVGAGHVGKLVLHPAMVAE
ncbi:zinc-binding dehydrogenase [Actinophytocola sp.]|uniref:zinc-binding dehydrogenase n=1 Tax=Actinophytocola sp. TaxID=1872138 RepID=UPI003D6B0C84